MADDLNEVLAAYADNVNPDDTARLAELIERHPEHEREIVEFAVYDAVFEQGHVFAPDEMEGESRFLRRAELLRQRMTVASSSPSIASLSAAGQAAGHSLATLAKLLRLGYPIMVKLDRRLIDPATIPRSIVERLAEALSRPVDAIIAYLRLPPAVSTEASYRSPNAPRARQQDFQFALKSSPGMSKDDRAVWIDAGADTIGEE